MRGLSLSGYMTVAAAASAALFFVLWWMLQGEEDPWVPAGLAASVVMLVAASAGVVMIQRTRTRYLRGQDSHVSRAQSSPTRSANVNLQSTRLHAAALRALQKQSSDADARELPPETHREIYDLCSDYLGGAEKALLSPTLSPEGRLALRVGQERVRTLQRHHLLTWARRSARALTHEAQQRVRLHDKVEIANRALDCIDSALKVYPNEEELDRSARAVREFITSSRVAHWVELAERAAFKGYYQRAIDCYRDALFYLTRDSPDPDREAGAERITREIDLLRARQATQGSIAASPESKSTRQRRGRRL